MQYPAVRYCETFSVQKELIIDQVQFVPDTEYTEGESRE